ncbi:MAG TPA: ATP-grasp domain-containing protein [Gammaproteobacteria bacterium]|nr:ATP-grasp domain-containing protein [Gammaproteobacteria bacterium]
MTTNVFVIGLDEFNLEQLKTIRNPDEYAFHGLIPYDEIVNPESYPLGKMLDDARKELKTFDGSIDAIIGHWDFPTTSLLPILRREFGLPSPTLESVLLCESKYWARIKQEEVCSESTPQFQGFDPFSDDPLATLELEYPFWIKPTVAYSSYLGFRIENAEQFEQALTAIRENIGRFAEPFDYITGFAEHRDRLPAEGSGSTCIAEGIMTGHLCTLEGYVFDGEMVVYGVLDSIRGSNQVSFVSYEYPSQLPEGIQERMANCAERILHHIGLDGTPFNMEFFWDPELDKVWLLEINPRISKSHCPIFQMTAGASHHEVAVDVALGRRPDFPRREGAFPVAGKFMPRTYADARVTRAPSEVDVEVIRRLYPELLYHPAVEEGMWLSELPSQDSYSFELADIFIGAHSHEELHEKFREVMRLLNFQFSEVVPTNWGNPLPPVIGA